MRHRVPGESPAGSRPSWAGPSGAAGGHAGYPNLCVSVAPSRYHHTASWFNRFADRRCRPVPARPDASPGPSGHRHWNQRLPPGCRRTGNRGERPARGPAAATRRLTRRKTTWASPRRFAWRFDGLCRYVPVNLNINQFFYFSLNFINRLRYIANRMKVSLGEITSAHRRCSTAARRAGFAGTAGGASWWHWDKSPSRTAGTGWRASRFAACRLAVTRTRVKLALTTRLVKKWLAANRNAETGHGQVIA